MGKYIKVIKAIWDSTKEAFFDGMRGDTMGGRERLRERAKKIEEDFKEEEIK